MKPEENPELLGHEAAEAQIIQAARAGRIHHAWLITGISGIGKATLAYRFARAALSGKLEEGGGLFGDQLSSLAMDPQEPLFSRIAGRGHGDLHIVERKPNPKAKDDKIRANIVVDQIRGLGHFFSRTSAEGGYRVAVIDQAEAMNNAASNALLKVLEEPPARTLILLTATSGNALLPTVRSRCRLLRLQPLGEADNIAFLQTRLAGASRDELEGLARLSEGSPGRAMILAEQQGLQLYGQIMNFLAALPKTDYVRLHETASIFQGARGQDEFRFFMHLIVLALARLIKLGARGQVMAEAVAGEAETLGRLVQATKLDRWIDLWEKTTRRIAETDRINLDRKQVLLTTFFDLEALVPG